MAIKPSTRLKILKFFKKYGKIILMVLAIWFAIIGINYLLKLNNENKQPSTTYDPQTSVMDQTKSAPNKIQESMEDFVKEYIEYCNNKEYEKAYNMISEDCKTYCFGSFSNYKNYVISKIPTKKKYSIQDYSNYNGKYIYVVKLYDDFLATGLTNSTYEFQEEKITASYNEEGKIEFAVGNFIERKEIQSMQENDYLKVDITSKLVKYSTEVYVVKFTNKSDKIIVVKNGMLETSEVYLGLSGEYRQEEQSRDIILNPGESKIFSLAFNKFYDENSTSKEIVLDTIRVVDNYIKDNANEENAIYKFSMQLGL